MARPISSRFELAGLPASTGGTKALVTEHPVLGPPPGAWPES
jgi:hypothetical protein